MFILALFTFALGLPLANAAAWDNQANAQTKKQPESPAKAGESSMTGCVDQQEGRYVLVDDRNLKPVASLEAEGFPQEGFAKYMGNKITVRGTVKSSGSQPVFTVRRIEKVSEQCSGSQDK